MTTPERRRLQLMHRARAQEISIAFAHTRERAFAHGLELGAGDCYQSQYLKRYVVDLTCTDFEESRLNRTDPQIAYRQCDAEEVDKVFSGQSFDLVFTSNMLTHTPHPQNVLMGLHEITTDEVVLVIVVPNPMWKLTKLALFYPLRLIGLPRRIWRYISSWVGSEQTSKGNRERGMMSMYNPKAPRQVSRWRDRLLPVPIGVYRGNIAEVLGSRRSRWVSELQRAGWRVVKVFKGPFIVGDLSAWWNHVCARLGFSTENIYVAGKKGCKSRYECFFA